MADQNVLHGSRAIVQIASASGQAQTIGIFTSCTWGVNYDTNPAYILGRYSPAEITYTGQEAINITATGYRVVGQGAYEAAGLPQLNQLMSADDLTIQIVDRQTGQAIFTALHCRPTGYNSGVTARAVSDISITFQGLRAHDESSDTDVNDGGGVIPATPEF
jgi:hypothetical protein